MKILFFIMCLSSISSCEAQNQKKTGKKKKEEKLLQSIPLLKVKANVSGDCDSDIWKYVYNPSRLKLINKCISVTGVIEESSANDDGDHHMLLKLDSGQEGLLTNMNVNKKQGNLVIEAVCANNTTLKKVGTTCNGYTNKIQIPKLGAHVKVTGSLVNDTHNGWNEIHPITKIEIIK